VIYWIDLWHHCCGRTNASQFTPSHSKRLVIVVNEISELAL
jgi:hypothetical protein